LNQPTPTEGDIWFDDVDADDTEAAIGSEAAMPVQKRLRRARVPSPW
jgi:RNA exonuclease 4